MTVIKVADRTGAAHTLEANAGASVMEVLRDANLDIMAICGGACSCATCHIFVDESWTGKLPARGPEETEILEACESYRPTTSRLSCQIKLNDELNGLSLMLAPED